MLKKIYITNNYNHITANINTITSTTNNDISPGDVYILEFYF